MPSNITDLNDYRRRHHPQEALTTDNNQPGLCPTCHRPLDPEHLAGQAVGWCHHCEQIVQPRHQIPILELPERADLQ